MDILLVYLFLNKNLIIYAVVSLKDIYQVLF